MGGRVMVVGWYSHGYVFVVALAYDARCDGCDVEISAMVIMIRSHSIEDRRC